MPWHFGPRVDSAVALEDGFQPGGLFLGLLQMLFEAGG